MTGKVKVLVVDDSLFMRRLITDIINSSSENIVIDTARNGFEAIDKVKRLKPDVITLDIEMPEMDGLDCLKELTKENPVPVIMLSSLTLEGADATIKALEYGAVDFVAKPDNILEMINDKKKDEILEKIKVAARTSEKSKDLTVNTKKDKIYMNVQQNGKSKRHVRRSNTIKSIVAIGASTGGPKSLRDVIPEIPGDIPAAFFVTQHMPPGFTKSLAQRLDSISELIVKEAEHNEEVKPGYVYVAPGDYHMTVNRSDKKDVFRIKLSSSQPVNGHRPSVDVMMSSIAKLGFKSIIAVIMTGMGRDGSEGMIEIKKSGGGYLIAQDEKTCVVYGMPRAAIETGVVDIIVPLEDIAKEITKAVGVYQQWI